MPVPTFDARGLLPPYIGSDETAVGRSPYLAEPDFARSILLKTSVATFLVTSVLRGGIVQKEERILEGIELTLPKKR
jgi:hypothetical protein